MNQPEPTSLSDWDVCACDERGRPCNGVSERSPCGLIVEINGNHLHLRSTALWQPLGLFREPLLGIVRSGRLDLFDVHILSEATPRGLIWATWFQNGQDQNAIVGLCVRGSMSAAGDWQTVTDDDLLSLRTQLTGWEALGLLPASLANIGFQNCLRFNQGDAFLAGQIGYPVSATSIKNPEIPLVFRTQIPKSKASVDPCV